MLLYGSKCIIHTNSDLKIFLTADDSTGSRKEDSKNVHDELEIRGIQQSTTLQISR